MVNYSQLTEIALFSILSFFVTFNTLIFIKIRDHVEIPTITFGDHLQVEVAEVSENVGL